MFSDFARQWTPLVPADDVTKTPRRLVLAGEPLVCWRDNSGTPVVLLDRCPHRSVSLSLGKRTDEGHLACAFHGWEFGADGVCQRIPFNPRANLSRLGAVALPHREAGGLLWVFTGFDPDDEPGFADTLTAEGLTRFYYHEEWAAHWTRAMENMLDYPHLPYVHRTTIGRFVRAKQKPDSTLDFDLQDTASGFRFGARLDEHGPGAYLTWYRPNSMTLDTMPEPRLNRVQIFCIPTEPNRTRMLLVTARNFAQNPAASTVFNRFNLLVLHQDKAVVESSDPMEVPDRGVEKSVPTDRPTLSFRTWYLRNLKGSHVEMPSQG